jgi:hypothetical protein
MEESKFSRLRRMIDGQHHGVSPQYLHQDANHAAWLGDNRRTDNGTLAKIVVSNAMGSTVSRDWKGYWQREAQCCGGKARTSLDSGFRHMVNKD